MMLIGGDCRIAVIIMGAVFTINGKFSLMLIGYGRINAQRDIAQLALTLRQIHRQLTIKRRTVQRQGIDTVIPAHRTMITGKCRPFRNTGEGNLGEMGIRDIAGQRQMNIHGDMLNRVGGYRRRCGSRRRGCTVAKNHAFNMVGIFIQPLTGGFIGNFQAVISVILRAGIIIRAITNVVILAISRNKNIVFSGIALRNTAVTGNALQFPELRLTRLPVTLLVIAPGMAANDKNIAIAFGGVVGVRITGLIVIFNLRSVIVCRHAIARDFAIRTGRG